MKKVRPWFSKNTDKFTEKETSTPLAGGGFYVTIGRLVPIEILSQEVLGGVKIVDLSDFV
jgi:hypothetical protein